MSVLHRILDTVAAGRNPGPFALLTRHGSGHADVLRGDVTVVDRLAAIPLPAGAGPRTLALVPFRQVAERGFACVDDGAPLECLRIAEHETSTDLLAALPAGPVGARHGAFDIPDREYADSVAAVLSDEIGRGEGANFVLHRTYTATVGAVLPAALRTLRNLLRDESGAYWTFLVHTGTRTMVGATP